MVRKLEINSRMLTDHLFQGEYHSAFKGRGMTFKEVKEYSEEDDVRFIDWNVSARMGTAYSKVFEEERELSVHILVDVSGSNAFGTRSRSKQQLIAEVASVLVFAALGNKDKTSMMFFTDTVEKFIPPKKGKAHALYMVRELIGFRPRSAKTDIAKAFQFLNNHSRNKSIVFVLSDFIGSDFSKPLKIASKKHDVVGIMAYDPSDGQLPDLGYVSMGDRETNRERWVDTSDPYVKDQWAAQYALVHQKNKEVFKNAGASLAMISTEEDYVRSLRNFFKNKA